MQVFLIKITFCLTAVIIWGNPNVSLAQERVAKGCAKWPYSKVLKKAKPYLSYIEDEVKKTVVSKELVIAVAVSESCFNRKALSHAGALGLMQLMPATAKRFGVTNRLNATQNIKGGIRYLHFLTKKFRNIELVIAGYNAGEGSVMKYNGVPPYQETQQYLVNVLHVYRTLMDSKKHSNAETEYQIVNDLSRSDALFDQIDTKQISTTNGFVRWKVSPMTAAFSGFK